MIYLAIGCLVVAVVAWIFILRKRTSKEDIRPIAPTGVIASREVVYGERALRGRSEMLAIRRRHFELIEKRGNTKRGSGEWNRLTEEIWANIRELDDLEECYFGPKAASENDAR